MFLSKTMTSLSRTLLRCLAQTWLDLWASSEGRVEFAIRTSWKLTFVHPLCYWARKIV